MLPTEREYSQHQIQWEKELTEAAAGEGTSIFPQEFGISPNPWEGFILPSSSAPPSEETRGEGRSNSSLTKSIFPMEKGPRCSHNSNNSQFFHRSILRDAHSQLSTSLEIKAGGSAEPPTPGESREGGKGGKTKPWTAKFGHGNIQDVGWGLSVTVPKPKLLQRNGKKPPWEYPTFIKSAIKTNSSGPGSREWENQPGIPARGCGGCPALGVSTDIPKMRGPSHKCGVHPIPGMQEEFSTSPGADLGV